MTPTFNSQSSSLNRSTILIVEDEARLAEILEDYLRREGFNTERAKDGGRALEL